jgi:hypothetical protein
MIELYSRFLWLNAERTQLIGQTLCSIIGLIGAFAFLFGAHSLLFGAILGLGSPFSPVKISLLLYSFTDLYA